MTAINAYFDNLTALIGRTLETQQPGMEEAAQHIADCFRNGLLESPVVTGEFSACAIRVLETVKSQWN